MQKSCGDRIFDVILQSSRNAQRSNMQLLWKANRLRRRITCINILILYIYYNIYIIL